MAHSDVLLRDYETLKNVAISKYMTMNSERQEFLNLFKERYKGVINSPRTYEYINDLESLFKILEKRCALSPDNIQVLEYIYGVLKINAKLLENYNSVINRKSNETCTGKEVKSEAPSKNVSSNYVSPRNNATENVFLNRGNCGIQRLPENVIYEISTRVGSRWDTLARYLKVQECDIHKITQDESLKSYEAKTRVMLQVYVNRTLPEEVKTRLLKALSLAGRMDLHDEVSNRLLRGT